MKLRIFNNELDASDYLDIEYTCLLKEWLKIREQYHAARLYKAPICIQNDVTPKTTLQAMDLLGASGDFHVLCHANAPAVWAIAALVVSVGVAVYTYLNMPKAPTALDTSGSGNNSLAQRQNKHRTNERVPDIYGTVKSIPDLIAPLYRYYENNIQVEECLMCIGRGEFEINPDLIKEGDTPVNLVEGASLSIYENGQSLIHAAPKIKIGEQFEERPLVAKQIAAIDGKQVLTPPNSAEVEYSGVIFTQDGRIEVKGTPQYNETGLQWSSISHHWSPTSKPVYADFNSKFNSGEQVIIENAVYGDFPDVSLSGTADVSTDGVITVAANKMLDAPISTFRRIRISALLVNDPIAGQLDLAGEYDIADAQVVGTNVYEVTLASDYVEINPNFSRMTESGVSIISSALTKSILNIDLSGTYTISTVSSNEIVLINPSSVNSDWNEVATLSQQQIDDLYRRKIRFKGSKENFIGWYYGGNKESQGLIANFFAPSGVYEGDRAKQVAIELQYQQVIDGVAVGEIYAVGDVLQGKANNRSPIGITINEKFPFTGEFRFRVKRENDNGSSQNLIDDVNFESAYSYYETKKLYYPDLTVLRLKRLAIGSGTNASELNLIVTRKINNVATSDFSYIVKSMATDPLIGQMSVSEVDTVDLDALSLEIQNYFGTSKACEFNYTFDDKNSSYQEMIFTVAEAVFCTARRENGLHYFTFERQTQNSLLLFNHRNIKPESMTVTEFFGIPGDYDGIELKWRDPGDNYSEAIIRLPDDVQTNYKSIEAIGVTNTLQAHFLAHRAWNKLKHNRRNIEFTGYGETDLITRKDRVAVVDNTIPIFCAGEIQAQDATLLTLDYPVSLDAGVQYVIHLQLKSGVVDVINIVAQINEYQIELERIPLMPLVIDAVANATFVIVSDSISGFDAYLIEEKNTGSTFEASVSAIQYSDQYYSNDKDFIAGLI